MTRAAVLGAGSWGTAFAKVLADAGTRRRAVGPPRRAGRGDHRDRHENPDYLPGIAPAARRSAPPPTPAEALRGADVVVLAVPSQTLRDNLADWAPRARPDATLVSLMKGVELGTAKRMSEVIARGGRRRRRTGSPWSPGRTWRRRSPPGSRPRRWSPAPTPTGPTRLQAACHTPYFRPYTNTDVDRLRARRRGEERHRARRRHGRRAWASATTPRPR